MAGDVQVVPTRVLIAQHAIYHDGELTEAGKEFKPARATEAEIAELRRKGALKLREELEAADEIAARQAALEAENKRLLARLAELEEAAKGAQATQAPAADGEAEKPAPAKGKAAAK